MFERLEKIKQRHKTLQDLLAAPETLKDKSQYAKCAKEFADLSEIVKKHQRYQAIGRELEQTKVLLEDPQHQQDQEFIDLAKAEAAELKQQQQKLKQELEDSLIAEESGANKNIIVEIRAGTGGDEAALFAADLYRMYSKYAANSGWKMELLSSRPTAIGGVKEIVFSLQGKDAYFKLRHESGVHRVQRVPATETQGRIHTSAVSVAVLAEPEEVEVKIEPKDIRVDLYRATGPGGQGVNTTDSAVRLTHLPSGLVVSCQDERSQLKNKVKAMRVLRARLLDKIQTDQKDQISQTRKSQVGSGDRSEKIRTYNFPDRRVTDHRIGLTVHKLESVLNGGLEEITAALVLEDKKRRLKL
ncbi:peptide chain release factor 1 [Candidatus Omnitrophota bacterium]